MYKSTYMGSKLIKKHNGHRIKVRNRRIKQTNLSDSGVLKYYLDADLPTFS